jgi:hypothetical protein
MSDSMKSEGGAELPLNENERALLLDLVADALGDTRVEVHRTHTPDYRDDLQQRESLLRGLIDKLRDVRS